MEKYWCLRQTSEWFSIECKWMNSESKTVLEKKVDSKGRIYFMISSTRPDLSEVPKWLLNMGPSGGIEFVDTVELDPDNYTVELKSKPSIFSDACDITSTTRIVGISETECEQFVEANIVVNSWGVGGIVEKLVSNGIKKNYKKLSGMVQEFMQKYPDHVTLLSKEDREKRELEQEVKAEEEMVELEKEKAEAEKIGRNSLNNINELNSSESFHSNTDEIGTLTRKITRFESSNSIDDLERRATIKKVTAIDAENLPKLIKNRERSDSRSCLPSTKSIDSYRDNISARKKMSLIDRIDNARCGSQQIFNNNNSNNTSTVSCDDEDMFEDAIGGGGVNNNNIDQSHTAFLFSLKTPTNQAKSLSANLPRANRNKFVLGADISSSDESSCNTPNRQTEKSLQEKILSNPLLDSECLKFMFPWPQDLYDLDISDAMIIHIQNMRQSFTKVMTHSMCTNIQTWYSVLQAAPYRKIEIGELSSAIV